MFFAFIKVILYNDFHYYKKNLFEVVCITTILKTIHFTILLLENPFCKVHINIFILLKPNEL